MNLVNRFNKNLDQIFGWVYGNITPPPRTALARGGT